MKKIDTSDLTFLIPVRVDSIIRLDNLLAVIRYIRKYFNTHIMVLESAYYNNHILTRLLSKKVEYYFIEDKDPVFYRTQYLNIMACKVKTPYLGIWDADVIIPPSQLDTSMTLLRSGEWDIVYPYDGNFWEVPELLRTLFYLKLNTRVLSNNVDKMTPLYSNISRGGAILAETRIYKESGMENEEFYGWGLEDWERFERWKRFNYRMQRVPGGLFHLTHPRDHNGNFSSLLHKKIATNEYENMKQSSRLEIEEKMAIQKRKYKLI